MTEDPTLSLSPITAAKDRFPRIMDIWEGQWRRIVGRPSSLEALALLELASEIWYKKES